MMELQQSQQQRLSQQQLQSVAILQMNTAELSTYLQELAQENPVVELTDNEGVPGEDERDDELLNRLRWLEDNDLQNRYYLPVGDEEERDPLARASNDGGLGETLQQYLRHQVDLLDANEGMRRGILCLVACLDDDGYLRVPAQELADMLSMPICEVERCTQMLRSLEPAGVGASSLSQCLELQLMRQQNTGIAIKIVRGHLEDLARHHYPSIARTLHVSVEEVRRAESRIQALDPRPGAAFQSVEETQYVLPDVYVERKDGTLVVRLRSGGREPFRVNRYYRSLLEQSDNKEVREYLTGKLRQADAVMRAVEQRGSTLLRCAEFIVRHQEEFFYKGAQALQPLRMSDAADELGLHESTISRAVREKYLACAQGMFPMSYFFSRSASAESDAAGMGATAVKTWIRRLVDEEDKRHPLSDSMLCKALEEQGCAISRRTVAKYRDEMNIASAAGRKTSS